MISIAHQRRMSIVSTPRTRAHEFILMSVERQKKLANAAVQKTDFGTSDGRGCTVIDLVSRRSLIDIKWPRASSYVLKTAIFSVVPPTYGPFAVRAY